MLALAIGLYRQKYSKALLFQNMYEAEDVLIVWDKIQLLDSLWCKMGLFAGFFVQLDGVIQALNECIRQPDNSNRFYLLNFWVMINSMTENNRQLEPLKPRFESINGSGSPKNLKREHWRVRLVARKCSYQWDNC